MFHKFASTMLVITFIHSGKSLLHDTDELCRLIKNTQLTVASWDRQKRIFANQHNHNDVEVGFRHVLFELHQSFRNFRTAARYVAGINLGRGKSTQDTMRMN